MAPRRPRELLLGAVALVLISALVWRLQSASAPVPAASGTPSAATPAREANEKGAAGEVDLAALDNARPEPADGGRNPFRFGERLRAAVPQEAGAAGRRSLAEPVADPLQPPALPRIPLKYIGRVDTPGGAYAVLSDGRGVYQGRTGEVVEGRYRIVSIGVESVELAYLDGRGRQTIAKTGQ